MVGEQVQRVGGTIMKELFENNPHATLVIQSWFMGKMLESLDDNTVPEDFREMLRQQGVQKEHLIKMVEGSPRSLLDVLDENDVIISIVYDAKNNVFRYAVNDSVESIDYKTRKEAEADAIAYGVMELETKIKES